MTWLAAIITGIVVGIIIYGLRPARESRANFSLFILLGAFGAVIGEWFFGYVLGITFGGAGFTSFRWDAIVWGIVGSAIVLAIYESYLLQPVRRVEEEYRYGREPYTSRPTAHEYRERRTKVEREADARDKEADDDVDDTEF